jgi:hypothetical protein
VEAGGAIPEQRKQPTNLVGNWDVTVTVRLTMEGMAQTMAEQLASTSLSVVLPACGWLREVDTRSEPAKDTQLSVARPAIVPGGGKGPRA